MRLVGGRDHHALGPGQLGLVGAAAVEALDLVVDTADGLGLAALDDRAGDRQVLPDLEAGELGEDRDQLGQRGTVALDPAVALLEGDRAVEGEPRAPGEMAGLLRESHRVDRRKMIAEAAPLVAAVIR